MAVSPGACSEVKPTLRRAIVFAGNCQAIRAYPLSTGTSRDRRLSACGSGISGGLMIWGECRARRGPDHRRGAKRLQARRPRLAARPV